MLRRGYFNYNFGSPDEPDCVVASPVPRHELISAHSSPLDIRIWIPVESIAGQDSAISDDGSARGKIPKSVIEMLAC
jgi:hypothetical protein